MSEGTRGEWGLPGTEPTRRSRRRRRVQGSSQLAAKSYRELATPQAHAGRNHPPKPWAEDVVCALGAGWNLRGVRNHHPDTQTLRSEFLPVPTIEPLRTGQKSDASACSRGELGRTEDEWGKDGRDTEGGRDPGHQYRLGSEFSPFLTI